MHIGEVAEKKKGRKLQLPKIIHDKRTTHK